MVLLVQFTVFSAAPVLLSQVVNSDQLETERLKKIRSVVERIG